MHFPCLLFKKVQEEERKANTYSNLLVSQLSYRALLMIYEIYIEEI